MDASSILQHFELLCLRNTLVPCLLYHISRLCLPISRLPGSPKARLYWSRIPINNCFQVPFESKRNLGKSILCRDTLVLKRGRYRLSITTFFHLCSCPALPCVSPKMPIRQQTMPLQPAANLVPRERERFTLRQTVSLGNSTCILQVGRRKLKKFLIRASLKIELALKKNVLEEDALSDTDGPELNGPNGVQEE